MKTKVQISFAVTAKLISAFVFATRIVQFLYFLNSKFPASSHLLCLYSSVCVEPVWKPHCWFSHEVAQMLKDSTSIPPRNQRAHLKINIKKVNCCKFKLSEICFEFFISSGTLTMKLNKIFLITLFACISLK